MDGRIGALLRDRCQHGSEGQLAHGVHFRLPEFGEIGGTRERVRVMGQIDGEGEPLVAHRLVAELGLDPQVIEPGRQAGRAHFASLSWPAPSVTVCILLTTVFPAT